ncbi:hypothetical protein [Kordiimonas sp. SCSIO 12610]|uniref:hypothetical protein n=1 Tax=Kordiimonas sp. SCSIO 12610 TaxID=2829597 RepID=UPI00210D7A23|nr:hypothetical protein [Kordiimonas sp. SCSIO 12610]UTW56531.1 hypothetical protein KFF44_06420 [Kordiimonas sp. SCSIO 12610]
MTFTSFKTTLLAATTALALVACGDSSTEIASPGTVGPNPGTGAGGGGTGGGGTGGGGTGGGGTGVTCPSGTTAITVGSSEQCQLSGTITDDVTLTSGIIYQLNGSVRIGQDVGPTGQNAGGDPAVLTIEPGVTLYGATAQDVLIVARGSQIVADGDVNNPITFTSALDLGFGDELGINPRPAFNGPILEQPFTSEWGGLIINGRATLNTCDTGICEAEGEGDSGTYGGDDDNDNSGVLEYVRVLFAGNPITSTDELNGIAFQGVGRGTRVDFLQVHNGADDGVEFFGGTVDVRHLIVTGSDDDSVDWTFGWRGRGQFILVVQNPNQSNSDRGIEADNREGAEDATPRAQPVLSNLTFVGTDVGDTGILLRRGTGANIFNVVATGFPDACFDLDDTSTFTNAGSSATNLTGNLTVQSTLFDCSDPTDDEAGDPFLLETFIQNQDNNVFGPSSLSNFINGTNEAAVPAVDVSTIDSFFDSVDHIGAIASDDPSDNWTLGWSFGINDDPVCPSTTTAIEGGCVLEGTITEDTRLVAGLDYFLRGPVFVGQDAGPDAANPVAGAASATLTIDAGVTIEGETQQSLLIVSRGSQLQSNGTRENPVVFTAINPESRNVATDTSLWGGLVINGRATINTCNSGICEAEGEGDSGLYGGNDDNDDSGQMFFTRVEFAGNPITSTDELNGIAFQGVGRGTEIDFLQVHNGADDGVEFFGGTVDAKHVVITGADDDSLDWTFGWRGRVQHLLIVQNENQSNSDRGFEGDNREGAEDADPRALPQIANVTLIGASVGDTAVLPRRGTGLRLWNTVATAWPDACYDIDDASTFANAGTSATDLTGNLTIESTLFGCNDAIEVEDGDAFDTQVFFDNQANNNAGPTSLVARSTGGVAFINGANENAVPVVNVNAIDSFFDPVTAIGAVPGDGNLDWTAGWTIFLGN